MKRQVTITERVKFLISHIIGLGLAANQEDLGKRIGIENKSYLSQLVNGRVPNEKFINSLLEYVPDFNKQWLYDESLESPFQIDFGSSSNNIVTPEETIKQLQHDIELLKKDVRYYADMADSRLQTIEVQSKLINQLELR
jgi:transcriptional regulator with XRE-family HTH domain